MFVEGRGRRDECKNQEDQQNIILNNQRTISLTSDEEMRMHRAPTVNNSSSDECNK